MGKICIAVNGRGSTECLASAMGGPQLKMLGIAALHYMHPGAWHGSAMSPTKQLKVVRPKLDPNI